MPGKRGVPLLEIIVVVIVLITLCVFAARQYKVA
jgi:Tfp pilus assembly protein PilE